MHSTVQKVARGRGNQGDWKKTTRTCGELPEHRDHNEAVRLKKLAKNKSQKFRRGK